MQKNIKDKQKQRKSNHQNKFKRVLHQTNTKLIPLKTNKGTNNQKFQKKGTRKPTQKLKNPPKSCTKHKTNKNENSKEINKSQNNNSYLELDYLNFSKIDIGLRKLNSSFNEDIFGSNIFKDEKNKIVSNRYCGIESSIDTIKTDSNNNYIEASKENVLKTPSTLCNYYDNSEATSSTKKIEKKGNNINNKNELRKDLDKLYENSKNNEFKYINVNIKNQNVINWRIKDSIKITKNRTSSLNLKEKELSKTLNDNKNDKNKEINKIIIDIKQDVSKKKQISKEKVENANNEITYKNNLMKNYLNSKIKKGKSSFNMSSSKKNEYYNKKSSIPKDYVAKTLKYTNNSSNKNIHNQNNTTGMNNTNIKNKNNFTNNTNKTQNINSLINTNSNYNKTITGVLMNTNNSNLSNTCLNIENKKTNNTTNGIYYNNIQNGSNYKKNKHIGQQKPIILCYDQTKYDSYFVTPENTNKIIKGKVQTSNKSTKIDSTSGGNGIGPNNKDNKNTINRNNNFYIIVNTKIKNKSFNKNKQNNNLNNNKILNNNNYINNEKNEQQLKINLKNHNKSSSSLIRPKGIIYKKNINSNSNINNLIKILNSGRKENSQLIQNLINKINNSNVKSPLKKYKSSNALKISKTLTEQNILNRIQVTPKYNKIPKGGKAYTTLNKENIYINTNKRNGTDNINKIKYNNSSIKKNYKFENTSNNYNDVLSNIFKYKNQSDFKTNKYYLLNNSNMNSNNNARSNNNKNKYINNNDYGMDRHVKQKLFDRMNKASNNEWPYNFRGNNNNGRKKVLMKNLSEIMKSPEKKDYINNNTIISNESEDEKEKKENNEKFIYVK